MSNNCNDIAKILLTDGTNQSQRNDTALDPESLKIHGFGMEEWMRFAYNFAQHLNFYDTNNASTPNGDWQDFFTKDEDIAALIASLEEADNLTPHLTLFICFLKLLELPNDRMNDLTKRHLDYYYKEILQIEKLPATYDKVHLLFELSKNFSSHLFQKGLEFNGGKDANGKLRVYELIEEFAANKATISSVRNFYRTPYDTFYETFPYFKASSDARTLDGVKEAFTEENTEWYPFGYDHEDDGVKNSDFLELPDAKLGFAVASETLRLSEGERYFRIKMQFDSTLSGFTNQDLVDHFSVYCTTEKGWIRISEESELADDDLYLSTADTDVNTEDIEYETKLDGSEVHLSSFLDLDAPAITGYDAEVHLGSYNTSKPVFRFILNTKTLKGARIYKEFSKKLNGISVEVSVRQMRNLKLENDLGILNPSKPMYPFSNTPIEGSNFSISSEEVFQKKWTSIDAFILWKGVPGNLENHYSGYGVNFRNTYEPILIGEEEAEEQSPSNRKSGGPRGARWRWLQRRRRQYPDLFPGLAEVISPTDNNVGKYQHFWAKRGMLVNGAWLNSSKGALFTSRALNEQGEVVYTTEAQYRSEGLTENDTANRIRIQLDDSFYHEKYPELYTIAVIGEPTTVEELPKKPYTPFAEDVFINYSATDSLDLSSSADDYEDTYSQLFHEHPFGISEEHSSIKEQFDFVSEKSCYGMPQYDEGGELYIGLEGAQPLQNVPLLFQISEGTENTDVESFTEENGIEWEILSNNFWKPLENAEILKNEVDNFLKSGLVTLTLPKEITDDNTILPSGQFWIRAKMTGKRYDAVCKFIGIHSQVALAQFTNNENETSHLDTGLPAGTISKLIQRSSTLKTITQPYNSFGGSQEESDDTYYRRVSERLRHKKRAVTIWDYENMVLQEFPDIYRAKCLSHSNLKSFNAGGNVIMVVIPDTVNKNVFNIYEPRVSTAYLNEIQRFLKKHCSLHVCLKVMNPDYEAIKIKTDVGFYPGFDQVLYTSILEDDITKLLAPWAFDETKEIEFGGKLSKSMLIDYIENLEYVDFVKSISINVRDVNSGVESFKRVENYVATSPLTIMVSATEHLVTAVADTCPSGTSLTTVDCEE
ncbi:MAG: baseplate J/gp47 family protein [bacterium]|nr:baseplate J/gp47 family protein [bacterium]